MKGLFLVLELVLNPSAAFPRGCLAAALPEGDGDGVLSGNNFGSVGDSLRFGIGVVIQNMPV
jgi:hypothetical protein